VQRAGYDTAGQLPDAEWGGHVRTAVVCDEDPDVGPGHEEVCVRQTDASHTAGCQVRQGRDIHERRHSRAGGPEVSWNRGERRFGRTCDVDRIGFGIFGGDRVDQIFRGHGVHDSVDRPVVSILLPIAGESFKPEPGPFRHDLRGDVARQRPQAQALDVDVLEAPASDQAQSPRSHASPACLRGHQIADGMEPRVGSQMEPDRPDESVRLRIHDGELA